MQIRARAAPTREATHCTLCWRSGGRRCPTLPVHEPACSTSAERGNQEGEIRSGMGGGKTNDNGRGQALPDGCQVAVVVDNVKVRHSAVALLLARLVFKLLEGNALRVGVYAQDFGWL